MLVVCTFRRDLSHHLDNVDEVRMYLMSQDGMFTWRYCLSSLRLQVLVLCGAQVALYGGMAASIVDTISKSYVQHARLRAIDLPEHADEYFHYK